MNSTINFILNGDADKGIWMGNFSTKLSTYAALVGITPAEVTVVIKDTTMFQYMMNMLEVYKQTVNNITSYKNLLKQAVRQQHLGAILWQVWL